MTKDELENNLGTIAKSGSLAFKNENEKTEDVNIIGQFGVGFYSAFMVAKKVTVISKAYGADSAYMWESEGVDGYTISEAQKDGHGTQIILDIKDNAEEENYDEFLTPYKIKQLVRKYSDYIRYPIKMDVEHEKLKEGSKDEYEKEIVTETRQDEERLRQQAKDLEAHIDDERTLTAFKRIRKNARNGLGLVCISRNACGGCFNRIPPQKQLEIRMHKKIVVCEYCGRIIIDPEIAGITEDK